MIFHSWHYLLFIGILLPLYWSCSKKLQNVLLLLFSYAFYGFVHPWFLILIWTSTVVDYCCGLAFLASVSKSKRRGILLVSLLTNLGLLGVFKYYNFFVRNFESAFEQLGLSFILSRMEIVLPVGISFYTFQTLSYTIDIYRGSLKPRRNFIDFALFVSFFPQLVAGPIERAINFLPQIERERKFRSNQFSSGLVLISWGIFKKLVIADNVARFANLVFSLEQMDAPMVCAGVFAFYIQIFADFSAYTDIARGSAKLLGFELSENFRHPYIARSPMDFWRRWHISLSSWFRDYVYIPLGGSRVSEGRLIANLFVTFLLSGLWHGASWNFIIWGGYHGALVVLAHLLRDSRLTRLMNSQLLLPIQILITQLLVLFGWFLFREQNFDYIVKTLSYSSLSTTPMLWSLAAYITALTLIYSLPLWLHTLFFVLRKRLQWLSPDRGGRIVRYAGVFIATILTMLLYSEEPVDFIYFQF